MFKSIRQSLAVVVITLSAPFIHAAQLVNINTADAVTIAESLNGIGATKAKAIIEYRELHGDFRSADDLVKVKGIGFKLVDRNSDVISFGDGGVSNSVSTGAATATPSVKKALTTGGNDSSIALPAGN
jgi:competence protein ComEA